MATIKLQLLPPCFRVYHIHDFSCAVYGLLTDICIDCVLHMRPVGLSDDQTGNTEASVLA